MKKIFSIPICSPGVTYTATQTVSVLGNARAVSSKSAIIKVLSEPLSIIIEGAQSVGSTESSTFSAKLIDPNLSKLTPSYSWSLVEVRDFF